MIRICHLCNDHIPEELAQEEKEHYTCLECLKKEKAIEKVA